MPTTPPIPKNEMQRLLSLADLDIDYTSFNESFKHLTELFAKIAGTKISLINLLDSSTQWSIANYGIGAEQMPRTDSVCQYTIMGNDFYEVDNLSGDERFKDKFYVQDPFSLNYYFGLPLQTPDGSNVGAICVLDTEKPQITEEKKDLLRLIANEVTDRLVAHKRLLSLQKKVEMLTADRKKVAHDIRGPLAGIVGLTEIIISQGRNNTVDEVLEFVNLINKSSQSLIEFADDILTNEDARKLKEINQFTLPVFKDRLEKLFLPQAKNKDVELYVNIDEELSHLSFPKDKLLQIASNLLSNAIKFTPQGGVVNVNIDLRLDGDKDMLYITVADSGVGMKQENINSLMLENGDSTTGTDGEKGYGLGLGLVKRLVSDLKGHIKITSEPYQGTNIEIKIPVYDF